jgi:hypothetical protein
MISLNHFFFTFSLTTLYIINLPDVLLLWRDSLCSLQCFFIISSTVNKLAVIPTAISMRWECVRNLHVRIHRVCTCWAEVLLYRWESTAVQVGWCTYCLIYWEEGLRCALIKCTLGSGKSKKGWEFGGKGAREQGGTRGVSLQATREGGGRFLSQLEGAK